MNKKDLYKLKPGTWLEISWNDAPNNVLLLLTKPEPCAGDVSLNLLDLKGGCTFACHTQVVRAIGRIEAPTL